MRGSRMLLGRDEEHGAGKQNAGRCSPTLMLGGSNRAADYASLAPTQMLPTPRGMPGPTNLEVVEKRDQHILGADCLGNVAKGVHGRAADGLLVGLQQGRRGRRGEGSTSLVQAPFMLWPSSRSQAGLPCLCPTQQGLGSRR